MTERPTVTESPRPSFIAPVRPALAQIDESDGQYERVYVFQTSSTAGFVASIPFFVYDLAPLDEIELGPRIGPERLPTILGRTADGPYLVYRFICSDAMDEARRIEILEWLNAHECWVEKSASALTAVAIPDLDLAAHVVERFSSEEKLGLFEWESGQS